MTGIQRRNAVEEMLSNMGEEAPAYEDMDDAIVGLIGSCIVYDEERAIQCFMNQGMDRDDAEEWIDYNCRGSIGKNSPLYIRSVEDV